MRCHRAGRRIPAPTRPSLRARARRSSIQSRRAVARRQRSSSAAVRRGLVERERRARVPDDLNSRRDRGRSVDRRTCRCRRRRWLSVSHPAAAAAAARASAAARRRIAASGAASTIARRHEHERAHESMVQRRRVGTAADPARRERSAAVISLTATLRARSAGMSGDSSHAWWSRSAPTSSTSFFENATCTGPATGWWVYECR